MKARVLVDYDWDDSDQVHHHIDSHDHDYPITAYWPDEKLYVINLGETQGLFTYNQVIPER